MAEKIKLTFLGTGSAIPTAERNHPAILLQYKEETMLFDCGEGTQRQFRIAGLNPCKLTRIFITHWHGDHVLGLAGMLQTLMLNNYNKTLNIYGPKGTKQFLELYKKLYVPKGDRIKINVEELNGDENIVDNKEFVIKSVESEHDTPSLAYSFSLKEKLRLDKSKVKKLKLPQNSPLLGELAKNKSVTISGKKLNPKNFLYKEPSKKITFILDTRLVKRFVNFSDNSDLLICESTYSEDEKELAREYFHLTSSQAAGIAKESKSKKLILTHLSQRYQNPKKILEEAKKVFKNTLIAEDLMKEEI